MSRGQLRVYLGAAPGVGKTYEMLEEGHELLAAGRDVVVGYLETHGRAATAAVADGLEVVPRRQVVHRGRPFEEMDVDAVLARAPEVALVDELAHTNVPGSDHQTRSEDVQLLLDAGIDVITTLNVQHLESVNDVVHAITGIRQQETVPDDVVRAADQIELVDLPPEVLRDRLAAGKVYPADRVDAALSNFFRPGNLGALREIALMWVADRVDEAVETYRAEQGIIDTWETRERTIVAMTGHPGADRLIRRASRIAARGRGDLIGVHVRLATGLSADVTPTLEANRELLESLGGTFREVVADDVADGVLSVARAAGATQVVLGASRRSRWTELVRGSVIADVLRGAGSAIDVHVISGQDSEPDLTLPRAPRLGVISARRRTLGLGLTVIGLPTITAVFAPDAGFLGLASRTAGPVPPDALTAPLLCYLGLVALVAGTGGIWPALAAATGGFMLGNAVFTEPRGSMEVSEPRELIALVVFALVAILTSTLADLVVRRQAQFARARAEVRVLTRLAASIPTAEDPLAHLASEIRDLFGLEGTSVVRATEAGGWEQICAVGDAPSEPEDADDALVVGDDLRLLLRGATTIDDDRRLLAAVAAQLATASTRASLAEARAELEEATASNALRTALLSAVSHDLRTPLASITASASSLLATDVEVPPHLVSEFARAIVTDAARLDRLISNLLDMSRLEAGATRPALQPAGLDDVIAMALDGIPAQAVEVRVPGDLPDVWADPTLLERVIANLAENAVRASGGVPVVLWAGRIPDGVTLRVIDRGPGIPEASRDAIFRPFQRLGDTPAGRGVGLGLAIAKGFTDAMGGRLAVDTTPGGGTTMTITLPLAPDDQPTGTRPGWTSDVRA